MPAGLVDSSQPPEAARRPHTVYLGNVEGQLRGHDVSRLIEPPIEHEDDLFWLRDDARANEEVLDIMKAEKAHTEAFTARLEVEGGPVDRLFNELRERLKETDAGVPYTEGPFLRYERTVAGKSYPLHCRVVTGNSPDTVDAATLFLALQKSFESGNETGISGEEVLLDENELAVELATSSSEKMVDESITAEQKEASKQEGEGAMVEGGTTCEVRTVKVSPDCALLAYSVDDSGTEVFDICFKRLAWRMDKESSSQRVAAVPVVPAPASSSASLLQDRLKNTNGTLVFGADSSTVFYLTLDAMQRPDRLWRHVLGTPQSSDACLFHEKDDRFWTSICRSRTGDFVLFRTTSKTSSEVWAIPLTERAKTAAAQAEAKQAVAVPGAIAGSSSQDAAVHDSEQPALPLFFVIEPRSEDVLYDVDHYFSPSTGGLLNEPMGKRQRTVETFDIFVILTNKEGATNFKLSIARVRDPRQWLDILPHNSTRHVEEIDVFGDFWQLTGREDGYAQIFVCLRADVEAACTAALAQTSPTMRVHCLPARDAVFFFEQSKNLEYNAESLRFVYSSPTCPPMTCEYRPGPLLAPPTWPPRVTGVSDAASDNVATIVVLKQKEVPGVNLTAYATARLFAPAKDGRSIPISVLYRPSAHPTAPSIDGENSDSGENAPFKVPSPLVLYGYGAYGISWDPEFTSSSLSLCDRGVVFAIAHVRGGAELGRAWYDEGKMLNKHNTFSDFIACAEHLAARGWTSHGRIVAEGGSAGGLLIGVVANARPDLWAGCIAQCPFLDGVVTMCDSSIPLVSTEWNEWGNPNVSVELEAIRAYDPMMNIKPQMYPPLLIEAGLNDTRVAYWEPLKFVQRVRAATTGNPRHVLFKVEMDEGHTGAQDRYKHLRDRAFELAWALECLGTDA